MLCSIEIGTTTKTGFQTSQVHYWVIAETLERAIELAKRQSLDDYPEQSKSWMVLEANIKSVEDPLIDWEHMNINGDASHARVTIG